MKRIQLWRFICVVNRFSTSFMLNFWRNREFKIDIMYDAENIYCNAITYLLIVCIVIFWGFIFAIPLQIWWRHQMETFAALLAICAGNSPVPGEFPTQRPVTRSFDVFFELRLNKRLSKQSWGWWFETLSRPLWRHRNIKWARRNDDSS